MKQDGLQEKHRSIELASRSGGEGLEKRRLFITLLTVLGCFSVLLGRLFWIQVVSTTSYTSRGIDLLHNSVAQREKAIVLDSGRGGIYDRQMEPLTGSKIQVLVDFPVREGYSGSDEHLNELCAVLHISRKQWEAFAKGVKEPTLWTGERASGNTGDPSRGEEPLALSDDQARKIRELSLPNLKVFNYNVRYPEQTVARQLIGFVGENPQLVGEHYADQLANGEISLQTPVGESGLERVFDSLLRGIGPTSISFYTDAGKRPLPGMSTRIVSPQNPYYPLKLVTTLDRDVQRKIEALLDRLDFREGAVVVLDAANADVLAMASRPQFDPNDVLPERGDWQNRGLQAMIPGSVFKTVVAAAALEEHIAAPHETFECTGELGKFGFSCWKKGGHGRITFEEAFAQSCNITFAKVMERMTSAQLESVASRLGIIGTIGWTGPALGNEAFRQFDGEEPSRIYAEGTPKDDDGVKVQTAIGQRDVRLTPLAAANLVVTLLHHGAVSAPRIVKEIRYKDNRLMQSFPERTLIARKDGISRKTSDELLRWMEDVVDDGTGTALKSAKWKLAGKSGTAQTGTGAGAKINQWFIGYGPVTSPRYAVAVVAANRPADSGNAAIQAFKVVMDILAAQT